jgi:hypothetical protein
MAKVVTGVVGSGKHEQSLWSVRQISKRLIVPP